MNRRFPLFRLHSVAAAVMVVTFATLPLLAQKAEKTTGKSASKKTDPPAKDKFAVPNGKPADIVKYISSMRAAAQRVRTIVEFRKYQNSILKAAEKLLASKIDGETEVVAIQSKFAALSLLGRFGDRGATKKLATFAKGLTKHKNKAIADMATTQVMMARAKSVATMKPAERKSLVDDVSKYIETGDIQKRIGVAMATAQGLEKAGSRELAATAYDRMAKVLAKAKDPRLANYAPKMAGSARRVMLLGNTIDIEGATVDGKPFKWSDYKGKVVLVDFWATWCRPCIAELPNVKRMYDQYHDQGFEVVGISLDKSKPKLEAFIKARQIKWTNLFSADPKATGWDHPMATYYGVMGIPNVILVDQKGKVVSMTARGPNLQKELKKLLGPPKKAATIGEKLNK